jgi:cytochrome c-type biogenesis protein CcmH/NrfG
MIWMEFTDSTALRIRQAMRRRAIVLALAAPLGELAGCDRVDPPSANSLPVVPQIDSAPMQPQVAKVLESARQAVVERPTSSEAWGKYGCLLDAHELAEPAAECYRRAWELDPSEPID